VPRGSLSKNAIMRRAGAAARAYTDSDSLPLTVAADTPPYPGRIRTGDLSCDGPDEFVKAFANPGLGKTVV
jgi:hypothetical protein